MNTYRNGVQVSLLNSYAHNSRSLSCRLPTPHPANSVIPSCLPTLRSKLKLTAALHLGSPSAQNGILPHDPAIIRPAALHPPICGRPKRRPSVRHAAQNSIKTVLPLPLAHHNAIARQVLQSCRNPQRQGPILCHKISIRCFRSRCDALCRRPVRRQQGSRTKAVSDHMVTCKFELEVHQCLAISVDDTGIPQWLGLGDGKLDFFAYFFPLVTSRPRIQALDGQELARLELRVVERETQLQQRADVDLKVAEEVSASAGFLVGVEGYSDGRQRLVRGDAVEDSERARRCCGWRRRLPLCVGSPLVCR